MDESFEIEFDNITQNIQEYNHKKQQLERALNNKKGKLIQ